jgi:hypothetical protein
MSAENARSGVATLVSAFQTLRRRVVFAREVVGGEAHIEIKPAQIGVLWNVHMHTIVELGRFVSMLRADAIAEEWSAILAALGHVGTCQMEGVDRSDDDDSDDENEGDPFKALEFYITKRKRSEWAQYQDAVFLQLIDAHKGRRLFTRFGAWYKAGAELRVRRSGRSLP